MAKVLHGTIKQDGKVFEAGTLASKLPKKARELAQKNGLLVEEAPVEEVYEDEEASEDTEE